MIDPHKALRTIRSYVRRESRITPSQRRALQDLWPRYGVDVGAAPLDFPNIFRRAAPVVLEIGFGDGEALLAEATARPQNNYLGIEVHRPGIGTLLRMIETHALPHVRVIVGDAKDVLRDVVPEASLAAVHVYFPDPWPKKRHHKRRLIQPDFAALLPQKLVPGAYVHLATDWQEYADCMRTVLAGTEGLMDVAGSALYRERVMSRRSTRFERRGQALGHAVRDLVFQRAP